MIVLTPEQREELSEYVWGKSPQAELIGYVERLILEARLDATRQARLLNGDEFHQIVSSLESELKKAVKHGDE